MKSNKRAVDTSGAGYHIGNWVHQQSPGTKSGPSSMHVISPKKLRDFWAEHAEAEAPLRAWLAIVTKKRYANPHELREDFNHADFLGEWRTIFDVGGNHYRISADVRYDLGRIYVRRVMTHDEYDRRSRNGTL